MRVAPQILQHLLRPAEGAFGIYDPSDRKAQERRMNMEF
jgi:hypothetical protein